ncbi:MAG: hypothetical protein HOQ05_01540 [Corynebacteriales bacterium]|nr:hypothetical protein [Mycobacteriales bacterium]
MFAGAATAAVAALSLSFGAGVAQAESTNHDLAVDVTGVKNGKEITTNVTVLNQGQATANQVNIHGLAGNLNVSDVQATGGAVCTSENADKNSAIACSVNSLPVNESIVVTIKYIVSAQEGNFGAGIQASAQGADSDMSNNSAGFTDSITKPSPPTISGVVFDDANRNGIRDNGEKPVKDVSFQLLNGNVDVLNGKTDAQGAYAIHYLGGSESYSVKVNAPKGYAISTQGAGQDRNTDSDVDPTTGTSAAFSCPGSYPQLPDIKDLTKGIDNKDAASKLLSADLPDIPAPTPCDEKVDVGIHQHDAAAPGQGGGKKLPTTGVAITGIIIGALVLIGGGIALAIFARKKKAPGATDGTEASATSAETQKDGAKPDDKK